MSYETLDAIADSYIPLLLIVFSLALVFKTYRAWPDHRRSLASFIYLTGLLIIAYGLMFLDNSLHLWPSVGLDYSTHTAVALSLVLALCYTFRQYWVWLTVSLISYVLLMLYQQYHSVMDILTTGLIVCLLAALWHKTVKIYAP